MPTGFPSSIDSFSTKLDGVSDVLAADVNNLQDAVAALQNKLGTNNSAAVGSIDYRVAQLEARERPIGWNQTWQDVTGSRAGDTWYQNTTGRSIGISIWYNVGTTASIRVGPSTSNWVTITQDDGDSSEWKHITTIVPNGHWYNSPWGSFRQFMELR